MDWRHKENMHLNSDPPPLLLFEDYYLFITPIDYLVKQKKQNSIKNKYKELSEITRKLFMTGNYY